MWQLTHVGLCTHCVWQVFLVDTPMYSPYVSLAIRHCSLIQEIVATAYIRESRIVVEIYLFLLKLALCRKSNFMGD